MCGIAGYRGPIKPDDERIDACLETMVHRGPDHTGKHVFQQDDEFTILLHSRLSIIDLEERANQPFFLDKKRIVYNGELYNYREIRKDLEEEAFDFETESDTEVLLAALDRWGWDALDRFEGMWSFALLDEQTGTLSLSRDRFGEKPLYAYEDESGFYFASEIKSIIALRGKKIEVNLDQIKRYLVNGYKALYKVNETFFKGLKEDPPASHVVHLEPRGKRRLERYWNPRYEPDDSMTYEEAVNGVRERLIQSVRLRLRADVPIAFCMSGGVDSNSLIAVAKKTLGHHVHGFTIVSEDDRYDESHFIEVALDDLDIKHTKVLLDTQGFLEKLRDLVRYHDAPVYTISYFAHWLLLKEIQKSGYRISVSGTGADELFTGYYDHRLLYFHSIKDDSSRLTEEIEAWTTHVEPLVRNPYLKDPYRFINNPDFRDHIFLDHEKFSSFLKDEWGEPFQEEKYSGDLLRNRMMNEIFHEAVPVILHEDDHNAMSCSVENRSPYLDRNLFEFAYTIPTRHLIRNAQTKTVLRDAVQGILAEPIRINRKKVGFNAPIHSFLDVGDPSVRKQILEDSPIYDIVRREKVEALLEKKFLPNSESKFLFYFLCAKLFLEEYV